jgi:hypothetical protein
MRLLRFVPAYPQQAKRRESRKTAHVVIFSAVLESILRIPGNSYSKDKNVTIFAEFTESAETRQFSP